MITAIIFIVVLSVLVFVHELGHFIMAKRAGMRVDEFGFGFPPRLWGFKRKETIYSINAIPFGGFVKILGENGEEEEDPRSFSAGSGLERASVLAAGVIMNLILAVVLLGIVNITGARVGLETPADVARASDVAVQIAEVSAGSPAERAGLQPLDTILGFRYGDGTAVFVKSTSDVQRYIRARPNQEVVILIDDHGRSSISQRESKLTPEKDAEGKGKIGVSMVTTGVIRYGFIAGVGKAFADTYSLIVQIVTGLALVVGNIIRHGRPGVDLAGPVGIAVFTGQAARIGFNYLLQFIAFLSVNLAVLNVMPFPALDGGRLLFLAIEKIKGSPLPRRIETIVNSVGFALLIALMIYVTTKDVLKFF